MLRAVTCIVAALALAACGSDDEQPAGPGGSAPASGTELTVVVRPDGPDGKVRRDRLVCPGDARCAKLRAKHFEPVPPDVACTEIYGGPATAKVTGTLDGEPIEAEFARNNGCEIARWDRVEWLLGPGGSPSGP